MENLTYAAKSNEKKQKTKHTKKTKHRIAQK